LMRKLDKLLSKYVRTVWQVEGHLRCYTCNKVLEPSEAHCGHYIPRTQSPTRYEEDNVRPQCAGCNTFRSGMPHVFRENLCGEIGEFAVKQLEEQSKQTWKWSKDYLIEKIEHYKKELS